MHYTYPTRLLGFACLTLVACAALSTSLLAQNNDGVVINEFVASNDSVGGYQEPDGGFGDWIELFNNSDEEIDLEGYFLSDDPMEPQKWAFPSSTPMGPGDYLIVWADDDLDQTGIHASFRLRAAGESLLLSDPQGNVLQSYTFGEQRTNVSESRIPNGTGNFASTERTTPLANNETSSLHEHLELRALSVYPNPTSDYVSLSFDDEGLQDATVSVYSADGQLQVLASEPERTAAFELRIDLRSLATGVYHAVLVGDGVRARATLVVE